MVENKNIIVTDNMRCLEGTDSDFIYIKKNLNPSFVLPFSRLYGLICDICDSSSKLSGIPNELISFIDMAQDTPKVNYNRNSEVTYFSPIEYDTEENVLNVIKLFNKLHSTKLVIYTNRTFYHKLKEFANQHIIFNCYNNPKELSFDASILLSHGYFVRGFIKQKIPVIVIGQYGLGGWVTPDNLKYLMKENFRGRPSGYFNEHIPLPILADEIIEIRNTQNLSSILAQNIYEAKDSLPKISIDTLDNAINYFKKLHEILNDFSKRHSLKPKLASNVSIVSKEDTLLAVRDIINDILFSVDKTESDLLHDLNGEKKCCELQRKHEMDPEEFWKIILAIWKSKAITLNI